jgi:Protein of unknown function (DUF2721)
MSVDLKAILGEIGPSAALVFASWIFMGFLQQRYTAADDCYRVMIEHFRSGDRRQDRLGNIKDQILLYKRRCDLMRTATNIGLVAAIFLITTLILAGIDNVFGGVAALRYLGTGSALTGLAMVAAAAALVIRENSIVKRASIAELLDIPELAEAIGLQGGRIGDTERKGEVNRTERPAQARARRKPLLSPRQPAP